MTDADLSGANLRGVDLSGTDLSKVKYDPHASKHETKRSQDKPVLTNKMLAEQTGRLKFAIMPNGKTLEEWLDTSEGKEWNRRQRWDYNWHSLSDDSEWYHNNVNCPHKIEPENVRPGKGHGRTLCKDCEDRNRADISARDPS